MLREVKTYFWCLPSHPCVPHHSGTDHHASGPGVRVVRRNCNCVQLPVTAVHLCRVADVRRQKTFGRWYFAEHFHRRRWGGLSITFLWYIQLTHLFTYQLKNSPVNGSFFEWFRLESFRRCLLILLTLDLTAKDHVDICPFNTGSFYRRVWCFEHVQWMDVCASLNPS